MSNDFGCVIMLIIIYLLVVSMFIMHIYMKKEYIDKIKRIEKNTFNYVCNVHSGKLLTFDYLRKINTSRCTGAFHPISDFNPLEWGAMCAGEVGEAINSIKHQMAGRNVTKQEIEHEMGDIQTYLDLWCASLDIDLGACTIRKFNIVSDKAGCDIKIDSRIKK